MTPSTPSPRASVFPGWPSYAVLALAAVVLGARWDAIPPRWVSHWGISGEPNGWSTQSVWGVFGPLIMGLVVVASMHGLAYALERRSADQGMAPVRTATTHMIRLLMLAVSAVFALLAVALPLGPQLGPLGIVCATIALLAVAMGTGARRLSGALAQVRATGHGAKVEGHHALYYSSAKDVRLWVPKLSGAGWTINFAHPWAWPALALMLLVPLAIVAGVVAMSGASPR